MGNWSGGVAFVALFYAYIMGGSLVIGMLYAASDGCIFVAMLAHFGLNAASEFLPLWTSDAGTVTPMLFVGLIWFAAISVAAGNLVRRLAKPPS